MQSIKNLKHLGMIVLLLIPIRVILAGGVTSAVPNPAPIVSPTVTSWSDSIKSNKLLFGTGVAALATVGAVTAHKRWPWFNQKIFTPIKTHTAHWCENIKKGDLETVIGTSIAAINISAGAFFIREYLKHRTLCEKLKKDEQTYRNTLGLGAVSSENSWNKWLSIGVPTAAIIAGGSVIAHKCWPWFNQKISTPIKKGTEEWYQNLKKGDPYTILGTSLLATLVMGTIEAFSFDKRVNEVHSLAHQARIHEHRQSEAAWQERNRRERREHEERQHEHEEWWQRTQARWAQMDAENEQRRLDDDQRHQAWLVQHQANVAQIQAQIQVMQQQAAAQAQQLAQDQRLDLPQADLPSRRWFAGRGS